MPHPTSGYMTFSSALLCMAISRIMVYPCACIHAPEMLDTACGKELLGKAHTISTQSMGPHEHNWTCIGSSFYGVTHCTRHGRRLVGSLCGSLSAMGQTWHARNGRQELHTGSNVKDMHRISFFIPPCTSIRKGTYQALFVCAWGLELLIQAV